MKVLQRSNWISTRGLGVCSVGSRNLRAHAGVRVGCRSSVSSVLSRVLCSADSSDGSPAGRRLRPLLAASPRHRHVGGVWRLPAGRRVLCLPHHRSLPVVRELVHQPRPLRLPVPELPAGVPAGLHPPHSARQQGGPLSERELFQYALPHQLMRKTTGAGGSHM